MGGEGVWDIEVFTASDGKGGGMRERAFVVRCYDLTITNVMNSFIC